MGLTVFPRSVNANNIANGSVSNTEFQYLDGVTSAIQTQLTAKAPSTGINAINIADGSISNTEFQYLDGVTSAVQTQIAAKAPLASPALTGTPTINGNASLQCLQISGVDAVAAANTVIGTTLNNGLRFYPMFVEIKSDTQSGTISVVPIVSIGTNSTSFNNIVAAITTTGLTAANLVFPFPLVAIASSVAANTAITLKFTTPASGVTPVLTISVLLFGVYL